MEGEAIKDGMQFCQRKISHEAEWLDFLWRRLVFCHILAAQSTFIDFGHINSNLFLKK